MSSGSACLCKHTKVLWPFFDTFEIGARKLHQWWPAFETQTCCGLGEVRSCRFLFSKNTHTNTHRNTHTPARARTAILINRSLSRPWIFALTLVDAVTSLQQMHLAPNHQHSDNVIRQLILACGGRWCRCFFQQPGSVLSLPFSERLQEMTCGNRLLDYWLSFIYSVFFAVHQPQPAISHQKLYTIPIKSKHWPHSAGESSFWHMFSVVGLKIDFSGELTYSWPLMTHGYPWCACLQQIKIEDGEGILSSQRPGNHQSSLIESFLISMGYSRLNPNKRLNIGFLH